MAYDASPSSTHNPATGGTPTAAWGDIINGNFETLGGAWTSFTPTWTGSGGNPAIGNGSLVGGYLQIGKLLFVRINMTAGSTTTFGTGTWDFAIPNSLTVANTYTQPLSAFFWDSSASTWYSGNGFSGALSSTSVISVRSHGSTAGVSSTVPFTWATGDVCAIDGILQVA